MFPKGVVRRLFLCLGILGALAANSLHAALPAISANQSHVAAVHVDGTVRTWGSDLFGELGLGRPFISAPASVPGFGGARAVSAGYLHTMALKSDGTVWGWGFNANGWLGDGTTTTRSTPAQALNLSDVIAVSTGQNSSAALKRDGTFWWLGQSGASQQDGLSNVTALALGYSGAMTLKSDGTVWTWGLNYFGQLGDNTTVDRFTFAPVAGLAGVTAIAAGGAHNLALKSDGTVWGWGGNNTGALGDGSTTHRSTPVPVFGATGITAISAGKGNGLAGSPEHSVALKGDGTVWAWGGNTSGQLGDGTTEQRLTPVRVGALTGVSAISAGGSHTLALRSDGTVWAWGSNEHAQLGDGTTADRSTPVQVAGLTGIVSISAGEFHSVAIKADGSVVAWGYNNSGQLGNSANLNRTVPARLGTVANVVAVASGDYHTLALRSDETVYAWGSNYGGQLGDGSLATERSTPAPVTGLTGVVAISASLNRSVAVKRDGSVWTWGMSNLGQLGNGSFGGSRVPIQLTDLSNIVTVSAAFFHSLAARSDGTVWAWGTNTSGEIGDGTRTTRLTPVIVPGISGVIAVAAGYRHSAALKSDGTVWEWGGGNQLVPRQVPGLNDIVAISAGFDQTVGLRRDGTVVQWAPGASGATAVNGLTDVAAISTGTNFSVALKRDGTVYSWGENELGQLGDGTLATRRSPVVVLREDGGGTVAANDWFLDLNPVVGKTIPADKVPVFLVVTQGIAASNVTSFVKFRAQDVGRPIYVFAYAPSSIVKRAQGQNDGEACTLAQLSPSGQLQGVTASTVQSYASNVLSSQAQAVSVLNNVPGANVAGATFCVGSAATPGQSVDAANHQCVVTVPGSQPCLPPDVSTTAPAANVPGALSGLWWNSTESGWGISFTQRRNVVFAAWYTYDSAGNPKWYVASNCAMPAGVTGASGTCNGPLYEVRGAAFFGTPFNASAVSVTAAGTLQVNFQNATTASMTYTAGGQTRTVPIIRQVFQTGTTAPAVNYTDLWWNANESGWGLSVTHQYGVMFLAWYVYDSTGKPMWYVASNCSMNAAQNGCSGTLYRTTGPAFGPTFNASQVQAIAAGTVNLDFSDANNATLRYTVNGVSASKVITRQVF